jgi:acetyltransferase-like isoleucine patch superfamily enzyme
MGIVNHSSGIARRALSSSPVRALTSSLIAIYRVSDRLISFCRARALFPDNPDLICHRTTEVKFPRNISCGRNVVIGTHCSLGAHSSITIGNNVRLSRGVVIETAGLDFSSRQPPYDHVSRQVIIEDGVWIGAHAIVLGGVTIGRGAIVAAGAVVSRSVGTGEVVAGVPARTVVR